MSKVTSKLQVTIPKAIAERYGIAPGDEIEWVPAGESIRVVPPGAAGVEEVPVEERLAIFDATTRRLEELWRERADRDVDPKGETARFSFGDETSPKSAERGWRREDLYARGGGGRKP